MALQDSGIIKISDLVTEFGGSTPRKLTNYYRGGSLVVESTNNATIPTSGRIKLTDFYNTGGPSISIISSSQRQIGGTTRLFYDNETFSTNSGVGSQTKLVIVYCSRSTSDTGGETSNKTEFGPCTVTGKTVTEVLREGESFQFGSPSGPSGDVMTSSSVQYICNLGNESSFNITLGRSNASGQFAGTGPAYKKILLEPAPAYNEHFFGTGSRK